LATNSGSNSALGTATFDSVSVSSTATPAPVITSVSATSGSVGSQVLITGTGFGASQGVGLVLLNNTPVTINSWSSASIVMTIPAGATSGPLLVSVAPSMNDSNAVNFTVTSQPLLTPWLDRDIGSVGMAGSATYSNGTFTVKAAGQGFSGGSNADSFHFVYLPLSGDGTIVVRVVSFSSPNTSASAGVMIRETLDPASTNADTGYWGGYNSFYFEARVSTGGASSQSNSTAGSPPYWVKVVRSGSTFSGYVSLDALNWVQVGTSQTINMAQNVYVGLAVTSGTTSALVTATFDSVSISSTAAPAPMITSVSATTGSIGSQVVITGTGFGASESSSLVLLNSSPATINSWSNTSIIITIPAGATSGPLLVSVAPSMNDSNAVNFTVTSQPLPTPWLDQDIGSVGIAGSASYSNGTFTVKGAGQGTYNTSDGLHFVYQTLPGNGTIVARVASFQGGGSASAGVMIRETLDPSARSAFEAYYALCCIYLWARTSPGTAAFDQADVTVNLPYWVKLIRSGSTFNTYGSTDGVTWTQLGSSVTIAMAQNVYVGLAVSNGSLSALATATFDNVSLTIGTTPFVTGVSPDLGGSGTAVTVTGSNFGTTQGTSTVGFNGTLASSVTSWSATQIVANVSSATPAGTGPVIVTVNSISSPSGVRFTMVKPTINNLTPPAAQAGGSITLNGTGFGANQGSSQVKFNSVVAGITSWSDTSVTVNVPLNAASGPVTLTEDGITSNGVQFTLSQPLSITGISPSFGPPGTSVTISGTGFGATQSNSTVSFYGMGATASSWGDTQIVAVVPDGATSGEVSAGVGGAGNWGPRLITTFRVQLTDSLNNSTTYISKLIGGQWVPDSSQGSGCSSCTLRGTISYTYDSQGHALSRTDELGHITSYTYDSNGNVTSVTAPIASGTYATTLYTYNSFGEVLTTTDPLGNVTTNAYDSHGNLLTVTTPAPNGGTAASVTQFTYNSLGELTQITDPLNNVTKLTYYPTGLINTITDAQNNVTTYVYDAHGNRTSVTDAMSNQTTFAYDTGDRL